LSANIADRQASSLTSAGCWTRINPSNLIGSIQSSKQEDQKDGNENASGVNVFTKTTRPGMEATKGIDGEAM
jgi:hypothetical protein